MNYKPTSSRSPRSSRSCPRRQSRLLGSPSLAPTAMRPTAPPAAATTTTATTTPRWSRTSASSLVALALSLCTLTILSVSISAEAILVQPYNYLLDDSSMVEQHDSSGSLSPFLNDQSGSSEQQADKDIANIIGHGLAARLRLARMLDNQQQQDNSNNNNEHQHLSPELAELIQNEQQQQQQQKAAEAGGASEQQSISSSMASMILNVAQAAAAAAAAASADHAMEGGQQQHELQVHQTSMGQQVSNANDQSTGPIMELDTSQAAASAAASAASGGQSSLASKSDLKQGPSQWFNPKETIPVLRISSMATPSKYKKVYFRSEKKLVDGAFHGPTSEAEVEKKASVVKAYNSGVQRRSSRGTGASSAPPSVLQDGVIDFLKKFRDVYVQTRPVGQQTGAVAAAASPSAMNFVSSLSAAALPLANIVGRPSSGGGGASGRPNLGAMLSMASSIVSQAAAGSAAGAQSAAAGGAASGSSSGSSSPVQAAQQAAAAASGNSGSIATGAGLGPGKSPLTAQSYVSFWSKTFPTWVRKMLKQMRRRSLYKDNSKKRHQHHALGQKVAHGAVASAAANDSPTAGSGSSASSASSGSSGSQSAGSSSS